MSQDSRIQLQCTVCKNINYDSKKSKAVKQRLEIQKFCKHCKKKTLHKETK